MKTLSVSTLFVAALLVAAATTSRAQQPAYEGTSRPPADDAIIVDDDPPAKPSPAHRYAEQPANPPSAQPVIQPIPQSSAVAQDDGIVHPQATATPSYQPTLSTRSYADDPDGDIVHPQAADQNTIVVGTVLRVRLKERLSSASNSKGESFHTTLVSDVYVNGRVLLPAGAAVDGHIVDQSSGHFGAGGTLRLRPETVTLADGRTLRLSAETSGSPGAKTRVGEEGTIKAGSRTRRDEVEYGGVVGTGVVTGAVVAGPAGALAGGLIGTGVVTAHLLVDHPQATLEPGTVLLFTLEEPLHVGPTARTE